MLTVPLRMPASANLSVSVFRRRGGIIGWRRSVHKAQTLELNLQLVLLAAEQPEVELQLARRGFEDAKVAV